MWRPRLTLWAIPNSSRLRPWPGTTAASTRKVIGSVPRSRQKPAVTSLTPVESDLVVFSEANLGDDSAVVEKKRILALVDIPRPEMIINAWVMQNSSKDPKLVNGFTSVVRRTVASFNDQLEKSFSQAWSALSEEMTRPAYFEPSFRKYLSYRYIGDLPLSAEFPMSFDQGAQEIIDRRSNSTLSLSTREALGVCGPDEYCMGYYSLFRPLRPRASRVESES